MDYAKKLSRHVREIRVSKNDENDVSATTTIQPETTTLQTEVEETTISSSAGTEIISGFADLFESFFSQLLSNSTSSSNDTSSGDEEDFFSTLLTALFTGGDESSESQSNEDDSSITAILKQVT